MVRLRRAQKLEDSGKVAEASKAYLKVAKEAAQTNPSEAVIALLGAGRCERLCLRNANGRRLTARAVTLAKKRAPSVYVTALVYSAMLFNSVGRGKEALQQLDIAETKGRDISASTLPELLVAHANALVASQENPLSSQYINVATNVAEHMRDDRSLCRILITAGVNALQISPVKSAHDYSERAHRVALRGKAGIDGAVASWLYASVLLHMGYIHETRVILASLLESPLCAVPLLDARVTTLSLRSSLHVGDLAMLRRLLNRPIVGQLDKLEEPQLLGPLHSALHDTYRTLGDPKRAFGLLEEAIKKLDNVDGAHAFCVKVAEHGAPEACTRARQLLEMLPHDAVNHAHLLLFDAIIARRTYGNALTDPDTNNSRAVIDAFGALGWPLHVAKALEVQGLTKEAARIYSKHGATGDVARLSNVRTGRGRPRKSTIEISQRHRQIIERVMAGQTNTQIASELTLSVSMIKNQLGQIYRRFGVQNRNHLVRNIHAGIVAM